MNFLRLKQKGKGFTLVELLVVIIIIGILATLGLQNFSSYFSKAEDTTRQANVSRMANLINMESIGEKLPATEEALAKIFVRGRFDVPVENDYCYVYIKKGNSFAVVIEREGKEDGGKGEKAFFIAGLDSGSGSMLTKLRNGLVVTDATSVGAADCKSGSAKNFSLPDGLTADVQIAIYRGIKEKAPTK